MNVIRILILGILLIPSTIYYTYYRITRFLKYYQKYSKKRAVLLTSIFLITMISLTTTCSIFLLFLLLNALLLDGIYIVMNKFINIKNIKCIEKGYQTGLFILVLGIAITGYGYWNAQAIKEKTYHLETTKALPKGSLNIIQISDLHFGVTVTSNVLEKHLKKISAEKPDVIVLTGDIFDENTTKKEMKEATKLLGKMDSTYGTYYILGNHDQNHYARDKKYTEEEMLKSFRENHIKVLTDEVMLIDNMFYIIGRKDFSLGKRKEIEELLKEVDLSKYIILLDHQPVELKQAENLGIDLELCGHTHAGQIWPLGVLMDLAKIYPLTYGKYQSEKYTAIVTSGMGGWNYPIRTAKNAEYVKVNIKNNLSKK